MKILWESNDWPGAVVHPAITCLDWIPSVGKSGFGLIAAGSESGAVGVTCTEVVNTQDDMKRYNFNLRGHHSAISMVAWNRAQTKLASCDLSGIIYVWVPNEERWSVELVNDRGIKVRDVNWSPSGTSALICYEDNFVLIGSSTGQRIWSNAFPVTVSCGVWAPDSRELILGLSTGAIQVLTEQGVTITERILLRCPVQHLAASSLRSNGKWTLALCSASNLILLMNNYNEIEPFSWQGVEPVKSLRWNSSGTLLAALCTPNCLVILNHCGDVVHCRRVPLISLNVLTAMTWTHGDHIAVAAAGGQLIVGHVLSGVPSLFKLVSYDLWIMMGSSARSVDNLPLPCRERNSIKTLDHHVIKCRIPSAAELCSQICLPSEWRWYCTVRPVPHKAHSYMLCMEHMGGLVPILVGRQTNRIIPQFVISLLPSSAATIPTASSLNHGSGSSAQVEDIGAFNRPSFQRGSVWRRSKRQIRALMNKHVAMRNSVNKANDKLLQVTSNVWCTRFKITALATQILPTFLAQVIYKTSVLHLQPRQMTVQLADLGCRGSSLSTCSTSPASRRLAEVASDHLSFGEEVARPIIVAPSDREIFIAGLAGPGARLEQNHFAADHLGINNDDSEEPLTVEEKMIYQNVCSEFDELRLAVERHIAKMKSFAAELEKSSTRLDPLNTVENSSSCTRVPKTSITVRDSCSNTTGKVMRSECGVCSSFPIVHKGDVISSSSAPVIQWNRQLDDIEYIDDDDSIVMRAVGERIPLLDTSRFADVSRKGVRQLNDIKSILDKLSKLANDLTTRCSVGLLQTDPVPSTSYGTTDASRRSADFKDGHSTVSSLRLQLKDIARRVTQIERKLNYGDELVDEVCGDLQQRIQHLKSVLGEQHASVEELSFLTMQNKAPFWNEANQVYQLDFGGRVTQESAKNFQIEYGERQVMQFGRIENGSYTLDFRAPFTAVQAFAVALASITQRLK